MCILFIYRNPEADTESYRLILAANRDENLKRPALPAHYWKNYPECIGGLDMEPGKEGGTWLGLSLKGKAGIILNLTNEQGTPDSPKRGRGSLITNYISSDTTAKDYLEKLHTENENGHPYNPFSLVLVDLHTANINYLDSSEKSQGPSICKGSILGFGNSGLQVPYKKVDIGKNEFETIVQNANTSNQEDLIENIITFMKSKKRHLPDAELQKRCPSMYTEHSSIFVTTPDYGTRTHSILLVNGSNNATFIEETLMPDETWKRQVFDIKL